MGTLTFTAHEVDRIRKGDRITSIDGRSVAFTVVRGLHTLPNSTVEAIAVTLPNGREANIYPDQNVSQNVTVERNDPKPKTRTVDGVRFVSSGEKYWKTEDGTWAVSFQEAGLTECDNPHP